MITKKESKYLQDTPKPVSKSNEKEYIIENGNDEGCKCLENAEIGIKYFKYKVYI